MSTSNERSNESKVWLTVMTADEATEILVLDGHFHEIAAGLGFLHIGLEPGIYKIRVRAGYATEEALIVLPVGQAGVTKHFGPLRFASPVPLEGTAQTHEHHISAASAQSRQIHVQAGAGSQIFVFARRWTAPDRTSASSSPPQHPARDLTLTDQQGNLVADFLTQSVSDLNGDPWAACNVQVTPGLYRLQVVTPTGATVEQTIVAAPGWQTQIFLLQRAYGPGADDERADLPGASILLARAGFDPGRIDMRLVELARLGLTNQRKVLPQEVSAMLWEKYDNPMLGIFGAHLLLLDPTPDVALLRTVVTNLRKVLGAQPHPDVEALALQLGADESTYVFELPPMLRRSWSLVINASVTRPNLVPLGSLAAQVAGRLWGEEPWLMWMNPPQVSATRSLRPTRGTRGAPPPNEMETALMTQLTLLGKTPLRTTRGSPGLESATVKGVLEIDASASQLDDATVRQLTQTLGLPRANIEEMLKQAGYS